MLAHKDVHVGCVAAENTSGQIIYFDARVLPSVAFTDPEVLVAWLPPAEMTGRIHEFDARVGGGYRMSLVYPPDEQRYRGKTAEREDVVRVRFVELAPPRRIERSVASIIRTTSSPSSVSERGLFPVRIASQKSASSSESG